MSKGRMRVIRCAKYQQTKRFSGSVLPVQARCFHDVQQAAARPSRPLQARGGQCPLWVYLVAFVWAMLQAPGAAIGVTPMEVDIAAPALDLAPGLEWHRNRSGGVQLTAAADADGIVRRIEVQPRDAGGSGDWVVFALSNSSDEQLDRLLVAPHYRLSGSGVLWTDLGASRIRAITPSQGFAPERLARVDADIFRLTLDPGAVVTFVAELNGTRLPQLYLWEPDAYKDSVNRLTFYEGIVLGIAGLLVLFLSVLTIIRGGLVFVAVSALAWAVLGYLVVDFGFWGQVFGATIGQHQIYRAGAEALLAATLWLFLYSYLHLNRWHAGFFHVALFCIVALGGLIALSIYNAPVASGLARLALAAIAVAGTGVIGFFAVRRFDRAIMLVPTWILLLAWLSGAALVATGRLNNDIASPALVGGLVLIALLIGFTVLQHAVTGSSMLHDESKDRERRALALMGSGDLIWDWDVDRDQLFTSTKVEHLLGLAYGALCGPAYKWLDQLHPSDRDIYREALDAIVTRQRDHIAQEFRLRACDGHYFIFLLRARPVISAANAVVRCVGTLADVTEARLSQERLLHDAVNDNLTGLPNRQLFLDRLSRILTRLEPGKGSRPTLLVVNVDRFRAINEEFGLSMGDAILLTLSRRMARLLQPQDTLARISGDCFGILLLSYTDAKAIAQFTRRVRNIVAEPIAFSVHELKLSCSIGVVQPGAQSEHLEAATLLGDAELAMYHARGLGGGRIEAFRPALRQGNPMLRESDLGEALKRKEIELYFQPIISLKDNTLRGFEALARWAHPRRGMILPGEFIPVAERSEMIVDLGFYVLSHASRQLGAWQRKYTLNKPMTMHVNISNKQLLRQDLVREIKAVLSRDGIRPNTFNLEITESLMIENPELAMHIIARLRDLDIRLSLDNFGTGYSSLSYLQQFPFDMLKIDRTFIHSASGVRSHILRSIVALAHDLGMEVVAGGIETQADAQEIAKLGAEYAQGFLYARPMSCDEAERYLINYASAIEAAE